MKREKLKNRMFLTEQHREYLVAITPNIQAHFLSGTNFAPSLAPLMQVAVYVLTGNQVEYPGPGEKPIRLYEYALASVKYR